MAKSKLVPFICPRCLEIVMVKEAGVRQRIHCDRCTRELSYERVSKQYKSVHKEVEPEERVVEDPFKELNERIAKWAEKCKGCLWWREAGAYEFCEFRAWHDYGPDKGKEPGDCKDYVLAEDNKDKILARRKPLILVGSTKNNGGQK